MHALQRHIEVCNKQDGLIEIAKWIKAFANLLLKDHFWFDLDV